MSYLKNDLFLGRALREYGEWAQGELNLLFDLIDVGNTVIDVGAFMGTHTIAFARHVGPEGQVYAFEPHPISFGLLRLNVEQNDLSNVKLFNVALSDYTGTINSHKAKLDPHEVEEFIKNAMESLTTLGVEPCENGRSYNGGRFLLNRRILHYDYTW